MSFREDTPTFWRSRSWWENDEASKVQHFAEEEVPKAKSKRAKSIQIEEIEENEQFPDEPKTPVETELQREKPVKLPRPLKKKWS
jgi:hypothetical protein